MLTVKDAARRLGISAALVYALCREGRIAHQRYGLGRGTLRISEEALQLFQAESEARPCGVAGGRQLRHIKMPAAASR